jgi:inhibitor of KinA sporulation pathway (predicted exonuclease)
MHISRGRALYLDLELTCGLTEPEEPQVIQIGIVEADLMEYKILRSQSYFVRPSYSFTITDFCTKLTGITYEQVKSGNPIVEVINRIKKHYSTKNLMCFNWGDDKTVFDNIRYNPFRHMVDLSWFHATMYPNQDKFSLMKALNGYGLQFEGRQHDAMYDSINLARLHFEIIKRSRA